MLALNNLFQFSPVSAVNYLRSDFGDFVVAAVVFFNYSLYLPKFTETNIFQPTEVLKPSTLTVFSCL